MSHKAWLPTLLGALLLSTGCSQSLASAPSVTNLHPVVASSSVSNESFEAFYSEATSFDARVPRDRLLRSLDREGRALADDFNHVVEQAYANRDSQQVDTVAAKIAGELEIDGIEPKLAIMDFIFHVTLQFDAKRPTN